MPYRSEAQRRFLHSQHPDIAARWDKEYKKSSILPEHVADMKKPKSKVARAFSKARARANKIKYGHR